MTKPERDDKGRFVKGASGNPGGRQQGQRVYQDIVAEECSPEEWHEIVGQAVLDAKEGDYRARAWLGNYIMGKPPETTIHELGPGTTLTLELWQARANARLAAVEVLEEGEYEELPHSRTPEEG